MLNCVIDLSHHNTIKDFARVKVAGVLGVIHKATAGTNFVDKMYNINRDKALSAGLLWGAYHWGSGETNTAEAQADHFLNVTKPDDKTLLALDYEPNVSGGHRLGPDMSPSQAIAFVEKIKKSIGRPPVLYTGLAMAGHFPNLPECPLWWARYNNKPAGIPSTWKTWTFWQYTGDGLGPQPHVVDGIVGPIDRDYFNGDENQLRALWTPDPMAEVTAGVEGSVG